MLPHLLRRLIPCLLLAAAPQGDDTEPPAVAAEPAAFDPATVDALAAELAAGEPRTLEAELPAAVAELGYDEMRRIAFRPGRRFWDEPDDPFSLDLTHLGGLYRIPVQVQLVEHGAPRTLTYDAELFEFRDGLPPPETPLPGFSGFRLRHPINRPDVDDEFLVFQGASYLRGVGRDQLYGSSARGLALRTAEPLGEEFPAFTRFWIERPEPGDTTLRFHALLESESVTGAYHFVAHPGDTTVLEVEATVYPRVDLDTAGLAPLTSMFLFDTANRNDFEDFRDAVHDAGGLQMITGDGQRLWRPLANPSTLQVSAFQDRAPQGFGLTQRRRRFADYGDVEARYERRPSVWVEPAGDWGPGAVVLVEIPVDTEFNDNIVAFWRPREPLRAGEPHRHAYRLHFCALPPDTAPLARVAATRTGRAPNDGRLLFVVDFDPADPEAEGPLELDARTSAGRIVAQRLERLPESGRRRATLEFEPGDAELAELRLVVTREGVPVSETWLHRWTP